MMTRWVVLATMVVVAVTVRAAPQKPVPRTTFTDVFAPRYTAKCRQTVTQQGQGSIAEVQCNCELGWIVSHYTDAQIKAFVEAHDYNAVAAATKACAPAP
jgi:hypothetical protein